MSVIRALFRVSRFALLAMFAGYSAAGCSSAESVGDASDAEPGPATSDAGRCADCDAGPGTRSPEAGTPPFTEGLTSDGVLSPEALASCYDGQDNDGDGLSDCASAGCADRASCCVGATSIACCGALAPGPTLALDACPDNLATCPGIEPFGAPLPSVRGARFFPNGDATNDSGVVLTRTLDPLRAIQVTGILSTPIDSCAEGCFESIALGLIAAGTPGPLETLRPLVAVVASASRSEVSLVLAGEVAARLPLFDAVELRVSLTLLPTGIVTLQIADGPTGASLGVLAGRVVPSATPVQLAVYGRNVNRAAGVPDGSYARDVSVSTALCDAPSGWSERRPIPIGPGPDSVGVPSGPSFAYGGGQTFVAYASDGALMFGRNDGEDVSAGVGLLATNGRFAIPGEVLADPDVHFDAAGGTGYTVYFANRTTGSIERMRVSIDGTVFVAPTEWLSPSIDPSVVASFDGPSVLRPLEATSGFTYVFTRLTTLTGETRIVRFALAPGSDTFTAPADWDELTVRTTQTDFGAFDRDEVASPAAYRHNGSLQVAFAGRNGARWGLGLMATDDPNVALWRRSPAPTMLTGDTSGFDALSVRDPAVVSRGTEIELLYIASDGITDTIGYASREATDHLPAGP